MIRNAVLQVNAVLHELARRHQKIRQIRVAEE